MYCFRKMTIMSVILRIDVRLHVPENHTCMHEVMCWFTDSAFDKHARKMSWMAAAFHLCDFLEKFEDSGCCTKDHRSESFGFTPVINGMISLCVNVC